MYKSKIYGILCALMIGGFTSCSDDENVDPVNTSSISPMEDFTDTRDGHVYHCVRIGDQIWMAENLVYWVEGGYTSGCCTWEEATSEKMVGLSFTDEVFKEIYLSVVRDPAHDWQAEIQFAPAQLETYLNYLPSYGQTGFVNMFKSWKPPFYNALVAALSASPLNGFYKEHVDAKEKENGKYAAKYGYLYSLDAARKAIPEGWRLPSDEDWKKLERTLGMSEAELDRTNAWRGNNCGNYLKVGGLTGFDALMGGCNSFVSGNTDEYIRRDECAYFWTSERYETVGAGNASNGVGDEETGIVEEGIVRQVAIYSSQIWRGTTRLTNMYRPVMYSVRCVKDAK